MKNLTTEQIKLILESGLLCESSSYFVYSYEFPSSLFNSASHIYGLPEKLTEEKIRQRFPKLDLSVFSFAWTQKDYHTQEPVRYYLLPVDLDRFGTPTTPQEIEQLKKWMHICYEFCQHQNKKTGNTQNWKEEACEIEKRLFVCFVTLANMLFLKRHSSDNFLFSNEEFWKQISYALESVSHQHFRKQNTSPIFVKDIEKMVVNCIENLDDLAIFEKMILDSDTHVLNMDKGWYDNWLSIWTQVLKKLTKEKPLEKLTELQEHHIKLIKGNISDSNKIRLFKTLDYCHFDLVKDLFLTTFNQTSNKGLITYLQKMINWHDAFPQSQSKHFIMSKKSQVIYQQHIDIDYNYLREHSYQDFACIASLMKKICSAYHTIYLNDEQSTSVSNSTVDFENNLVTFILHANTMEQSEDFEKNLTQILSFVFSENYLTKDKYREYQEKGLSYSSFVDELKTYLFKELLEQDLAISSNQDKKRKI